MKVKLTPEQRRSKVLNGKDIYRIMKEVLMRQDKIDRDKEHFWLVGLAPNDTILFVELIHIGTFESVPIGPNEIFRVSVIKNATKIVFVHNHPSLEPRPSGADEEETNRLVQAALLLNIQVVDHLIITPRSYFSFADSGLLDVLKFDSIFEPKYVAAQKAAEKARTEAEAVTKMVIAERLLLQGLSPEVIAQGTGMPVGEVKKLQREIRKRQKENNAGE